MTTQAERVEPQEAGRPSEGAGWKLTYDGDEMVLVANALLPWLQNYPPSTRPERSIEAANSALTAFCLHRQLAALKAKNDASSHSTCGIAPLGDEPKPSTREEEAPVSEAVAWTGSGSLDALKRGMHGFTWPYPSDAHPIALYTHSAPSPASAWKPIDADTPTDRMIIAMCRYPEATAGSPSFVLWDGEFGWEFSRRAPDKMVCWAWMERDVLGAWPSDPSPTTVNNKGET